MIFSTGTSIWQNYSTFSGEDILPSSSVKDIGVHCSSDQTWSIHVSISFKNSNKMAIGKLDRKCFLWQIKTHHTDTPQDISEEQAGIYLSCLKSLPHFWFTESWIQPAILYSPYFGMQESQLLGTIEVSWSNVPAKAAWKILYHTCVENPQRPHPQWHNHWFIQTRSLWHLLTCSTTLKAGTNIC